MHIGIYTIGIGIFFVLWGFGYFFDQRGTIKQQAVAIGDLRKRVEYLEAQVGDTKRFAERVYSDAAKGVS